MRPMQYVIEWEKNGVLVRFLGIYDFKTNADASLEFLNDARCENINYAIWDFSTVFEQKMSDEEVDLTASHDQLISSRLPPIKMALLAQSNDTHKLANRYVASYGASHTGWDFKVFDTMEEIRSWVQS